MFIINEENFSQVIESLLRCAVEYRKPDAHQLAGILFDEETKSLRVITAFFTIGVFDVEFDFRIPKDKPFYNILIKDWTPYPYRFDIFASIKNKVDSLELVGCTQYNAMQIKEIISKDIDSVMEKRARFIFVQGQKPQGCFPVVFKEKTRDGLPVLRMGNDYLIPFMDSPIPPEAVELDRTYLVKFEKGSDGKPGILIVDEFGCTRAGMLVVSDYYDSSKLLPQLNNLEIIHKDLMLQSPVLESARTMPPIHMNAMLLNDLMSAFGICKDSNFELHFQEKINDPIFIQGISKFDEDPKIEIIAATLDYFANVQKG